MTETKVNQPTPQVSMEAGFQLFGKAGNAAVKSEMGQLHTQEVMKLVKTKVLTPAQRQEALAYLMLLKQKWFGKVKARRCAGQCAKSHIMNLHLQLWQLSMCF